jgi:hypothetical protein
MNRFNRNIKVDIVVYNKHYLHIMARPPPVLSLLRRYRR